MKTIPTKLLEEHKKLVVKAMKYHIADKIVEDPIILGIKYHIICERIDDFVMTRVTVINLFYWDKTLANEYKEG